MLVGRKNEIDLLNKCTTRWLFPFCSHLRKEKDREDISDTGNLWISIHFSTRRSVRRWNEGAAVCVYSFPERCRLWGTRQTSQLAGSFWRTERSDQTVKGKKKSDFLDELSGMDTPKSDLMMALENFWNSFASARKDIVLIVCASATSWMLSKVVHNKGGL